ncbi:MAG: PilZ domain-containing protein [Acidobacteriota bacterium]
MQTFARVVDISRSGVGLLLQQPIDEGTRVKIRIDDTAIFGSVRYCNGCPDGTFRAGVASDTVVADSAVRD